MLFRPSRPPLSWLPSGRLPSSLTNINFRSGSACRVRAGGRARVQQARKVAVQALVARDELVGEGEPVHQAALLEPEDGAEGAREEDALYARPRHQPLREGRLAAAHARLSGTHHREASTSLTLCVLKDMLLLLPLPCRSGAHPTKLTGLKRNLGARWRADVPPCHHFDYPLCLVKQSQNMERQCDLTYPLIFPWVMHEHKATTGRHRPVPSHSAVLVAFECL